MIIPGQWTPPFYYDNQMYIWDAKNNMVADIDYIEGSRPQPRGYGRIQYLPNGEQVMSEWEKWFATYVSNVTDNMVDAVAILNKISQS